MLTILAGMSVVWNEGHLPALTPDAIRNSELSGLTKAVGLMNEQVDLGQFSSSDPSSGDLGQEGAMRFLMVRTQ